MLGEFREGEGWWYYFLVALFVKTTLPFLLLLVVAAGALWVRRPEVVKEGSLYVWTAPLVILLVSSASDINIGIRHVLPMYPFLPHFQFDVLHPDLPAAFSVFIHRG